MMIEALTHNRFLKNLLVLLQMIRFRNAIITLFGVIIGATLVYTESGIPLQGEVILAGIVAFLIVGGGNTLNDFFDYEIDKINKPNRPLPAGKISRSDVLMLSASLFLIGLGLAKSINKYCLIIGLINTLILIIYAKFSKRLLLISNLSISYLVASVFLFGAFSLSSDVGLEIHNMKLVIVLFASAFLMTFSREIMKDIEDLEGDSRAYSKTLPIRLGAKNARILAIFFGVVAIFISLIPIIFQYPTINQTVYAVIIGTADLVFIAALTMYAPLSQKVMILGMIFSMFGFFWGNLKTKI